MFAKNWKVANFELLRFQQFKISNPDSVGIKYTLCLGRDGTSGLSRIKLCPQNTKTKKHSSTNQIFGIYIFDQLY